MEGFAYGVPSLTFADLNAVFDIYDETAMLLCHERSDEALSAAMAQALETASGSGRHPPPCAELFAGRHGGPLSCVVSKSIVKE